VGAGVTQLALSFDQPPPRAPRTAALRSFVPTGQTPAEALAGEARAASQEERVAAWIAARAPIRFTPYDVAEALSLCLNSARRAMTKLAGRGVLVHHRRDRRPAGPHGQKSSVWSAS